MRENTMHHFEINEQGAVMLDGNVVKGIKAYNLFRTAESVDGSAKLIVVMDVLTDKYECDKLKVQQANDKPQEPCEYPSLLESHPWIRWIPTIISIIALVVAYTK